jgi:hypothetical protein
VAEFAGAVEVFCHCDPGLAGSRAAARIGAGRHPIHRDVINPAGVGAPARIASVAATVTSLGLGGPLVDVDTGPPGAVARAITAVRAILDPR